MSDNKIVKKGGENPEELQKKSSGGNGQNGSPGPTASKYGQVPSFDEMLSRSNYSTQNQGATNGSNGLSVGGFDNYEHIGGQYVDFDRDLLAAQKYGVNVQKEMIGTDYLKNEVADAQSDWDAFGNSLVHLVGGTVSNLVTGVGGTGLEIFQGITGQGMDFKNSIFDAQHEFDEYLREELPVYRRTDSYAFAPWDGEWWSNSISQFGPTIALMSLSFVGAGAISPAIMRGASGAMANIGKTGNFLSKYAPTAAKAFQRAAQATSQGTKLFRQGVSFTTSFGSRVIESSMEASQTYMAKYDELRSEGMSHEEAKKIAGEAAQSNFLMNMPLMVMDYFQIDGILKGFGAGNGSRITSGLLFQSASEGVEEGAQYWMDNQARGEFDEMSFAESIKQITGERDFWDAFVQGAMGGAVFAGGGKILQSTRVGAMFSEKAKKQYEREKKIRQRVKDTKGLDKSLTDEDYKFVNEMLDVEDVGILEDLEAQLQQQIENSSEEELAAKMGTSEVEVAPGVKVGIKEHLENRLELIGKIKGLRKSVLNRFGTGDIAREILNDRINHAVFSQKKKALQTKLDQLNQEFETTSEDMLTPQGRERLALKRRGSNIKAAIERIKNDEIHFESNQEKEATLKNLNEQLEEFRESYKALRKQHKEALKSDPMIGEENFEADEQYIQNEEQITPIHQAAELYNSLEKYYRNQSALKSTTDYFTKSKKDRFKDKIDNVSSKYELEDMLNRNQRNLDSADENRRKDSVKITDDIANLIEEKRQSLETLEETAKRKERSIQEQIDDLKHKHVEADVLYDNLDEQLSEIVKDPDRRYEESSKILDRMNQAEHDLHWYKVEIERLKEKAKQLGTKGAAALEESEVISDRIEELLKTKHNRRNLEKDIIDYRDKANNLIRRIELINSTVELNGFYNEEILNEFNQFKAELLQMRSNPNDFSKVNYERAEAKREYFINPVLEAVHARINALQGTPVRNLTMADTLSAAAADDVTVNVETGEINWKGDSYWLTEPNIEDSLLTNDAGEIIGLVAVNEDLQITNLVIRDSAVIDELDGNIIESNEEIIYDLIQTVQLMSLVDRPLTIKHPEVIQQKLEEAEISINNFHLINRKVRVGEWKDILTDEKAEKVLSAYHDMFANEVDLINEYNKLKKELLITLDAKNEQELKNKVDSNEDLQNLENKINKLKSKRYRLGKTAFDRLKEKFDVTDEELKRFRKTAPQRLSTRITKKIQEGRDRVPAKPTTETQQEGDESETGDGGASVQEYRRRLDEIISDGLFDDYVKDLKDRVGQGQDLEGMSKWFYENFEELINNPDISFDDIENLDEIFEPKTKKEDTKPSDAPTPKDSGTGSKDPIPPSPSKISSDMVKHSKEEIERLNNGFIANYILKAAYRDYQANIGFADNILETYRKMFRSRLSEEELNQIDDFIEESKIQSERFADYVNNPNNNLTDKTVRFEVDTELLRYRTEIEEANNSEEAEGFRRLYNILTGTATEKGSGPVGDIPIKMIIEDSGETYEAYLHDESYVYASSTRAINGVDQYTYMPPVVKQDGKAVSVESQTADINGERFVARKVIIGKGKESDTVVYVENETELFHVARNEVASFLAKIKRAIIQESLRGNTATSTITDQSNGHLQYVSNEQTEEGRFPSIPFDTAIKNTTNNRGHNVGTSADLTFAIYDGANFKTSGKLTEKETKRLTALSKYKGGVYVVVTLPTGLKQAVPVKQRLLNTQEASHMIDAMLGYISDNWTPSEQVAKNIRPLDFVNLLAYEGSIEISKEDNTISFDNGRKVITTNENGEITDAEREALSTWIEANIPRRVSLNAINSELKNALRFPPKDSKSITFLGKEYDLNSSYNEFITDTTNNQPAVVESFIQRLEALQSTISLNSQLDVAKSTQTEESVSLEKDIQSTKQEDEVVDDTSDDDAFLDALDAMASSHDQIAQISKKDLEEQRSWWKKNLPQIPLEVVDKLIPISNNKKAFGAFITGIETMNSLGTPFKVMVSTMQSKNRPGAIYHEAIHPVWQLLLTDSERTQILAELKKKFGTPSQKQINELDGTNKTEEKWYEEKLAEMYREWKISPQTQLQKPQNLIEKFFSWIRDIISAFTGNRSKIDSLFKGINNGKFANRVPVTDRISNHAVSYMSETKPLPLTVYHDYFDSLISQSFSAIDFENYDGNFNLVKDDPSFYTDILRERRDKWGGILMRKADSISEGKIAAINRITDRIGTMINYINENFDSFKSDLEAYIEDQYGIAPNEMNETNEYEDTGEVVKRPAYEKHYKEKASAFTKLLIGTNETESVNPITGMNKVVPFSGLYNLLIKKLANTRAARKDGNQESSVQSMMDVIKFEAQYRPQLEPFLSRLEQLYNNPDTKHLTRAVFSAFNNSSKNFVTAFITPGTKNQKFRVDISPSSVGSTYIEILNEFQSNFQISDNVLVREESVGLDVETLQENISNFNELRDDIENNLARPNRIRNAGMEDVNKTIDDIVGVLSEFGMEFNPDTIRYYIDNNIRNTGEKPSVELRIFELVSMMSDLSYIVSQGENSFSSLAKEYADIMENETNEKQRNKRLNAIMVGQDIKLPFDSEVTNIKKLAEFESEFRYDYLDHNIVGAGSTSVFLYSDPSYIDIVVDNFKRDTSELEKIRNHSYHRNSLGIEEILKAKEENRLDVEVHTLNTIVIRDRFDTGEKQSRMDIPDEIAFSMNAMLNDRKKSGGKSLYRMTSFGAKSTAHKFLSGIGVFDRNHGPSEGSMRSLFAISEDLTQSSELKDLFSRYILDEIERMEDLSQETSEIEGLHENGYLSYLFPELRLFPHYLNNSKAFTKVDSKTGKKVLTERGKQLQKSYDERYKKLMKQQIKNFKKYDPNVRENLGKFYNLLDMENTFPKKLEITSLISNKKMKLKGLPDMSFVEYKMKLMIDSTIDQFTEMNMIDPSTKELIFIDEEIKEFYRDKYNAKEGAVTRIIVSDYILNSIMANQETTKLFTMDPAWYSNIIDFTKRTPALLTTGQYGDFESETYNVAVAKTVEKPSDFFKEDSSVYNNLVEGYKELFERYNKQEGLSVDVEKRAKKLASDVINSYQSMDVTDAQSYITFNRFVDIMNALGRKIDQGIINRFMSGKETISDIENIAKDIEWFNTQPLKGVYFSNNTHSLNKKDVNGEMSNSVHGNYLKPNYHKYSQAVIWPSLVKDTQLEKSYNQMVRQEVDEIIVDSGYKVGVIEATDITADNFEFNVMEMYNRDWKLQQQLPSKYWKSGYMNRGTQKDKNILANIDKTKNYTENLTGQDIVNIINSVDVTLANKGMNNLRERYQFEQDQGIIKNREEFLNQIKQNLMTRNLPSNVIEQIRNIESLDELITFKREIQYSIASIVEKSTTKINEPGGAFIQMSNYGINKASNLIDKNTDIVYIDDFNPSYINKNGDFVPGSVLLPHRIQLLIEKVAKKPIRELSKKQIMDIVSEDALGMIGYRIPNQGITSIEKLKVAGFLPHYMGDTVVVNDETTTKYGSDFDIDKLYIVQPHVYITEGKVERVPFINSDNLEDHFDFRNKYLTNEVDRIKNILQNESNKLSLERQEELNNELIDLEYEVYEKYSEFEKENKGKSVYELNTKHQLQNRKIEMQEVLLEDQTNWALSVLPLDLNASWLKNQVKDLYGETDYRQDTMFWTDIVQLQIKDMNLKAKRGVGLGANTEVDYVLNQLADVQFDIGLGRTSYSNQFDENGNLITHNIDAFINAFVDAEKDPFILAANYNEYTFNPAMILYKLGYNRDFITQFIGQPVLKDLVKINNIRKGRFYRAQVEDEFKDEFDQLTSRDKKLNKAYRKIMTERNIEETYDFVNGLFESGKLRKAIEKRQENPSVVDAGLSVQEQAAVLALFKKINFFSDTDLSATLASKFDVSGMGKGVVDAFSKEEQIMKAMNIDRETYDKYFIPMLEGRLTDEKMLSEVFDKGPLKNFWRKFMNTSLGGYYKTSVVDSLELFKNEFISASDRVQDIVKEINLQIGNVYATNTEINQKIADNVYAYLMSDMPMFKIPREEVERLFFNKKDSNSLALKWHKMMKGEKGKKSPLAKTVLGRVINAYAGKSKERPYFLYTDNFKLKSTAVRNEVADQIKDILNNVDPGLNLSNQDIASVKSMLQSLIEYSFYNSGFIYGSKSIFDLLPVEVFDEIKEHLNGSVKDFIQDDSSNAAVIDQIFRQNWFDSSLVPQIYDVESVTKNLPFLPKDIFDNGVYVRRIPMSKVRIGFTEEGLPVPSRFATIHTGKGRNRQATLYKVVGIEADHVIYTPTSKLGYRDKGQRIVEYYKGEGVSPRSLIEGNNLVEMDTSILLEHIISENPKRTFVDPASRQVTREVTQEDLTIEESQEILEQISEEESSKKEGKIKPNGLPEVNNENNNSCS